MQENNENNLFEEKPEEGRHHSSRHGSHHSSHHSSHHRSHHSGRRSGHSDSQKKVVRSTYKKVKYEKFYRPLLRLGFFVVIIGLLFVFVWTIFNPSEDVKEAVDRNEKVIDNVAADVRIKELEAEIAALDAELVDYKKRLAELEGKLAAAEAAVSADAGDAAE